MKIQYYKSRDWRKARTIAYYLVDLESYAINRCTGMPYYVSYAPIGQHSEVHPDYMRYNSIKITREEYIQATSHLYTPEDYIN